MDSNVFISAFLSLLYGLLFLCGIQVFLFKKVYFSAVKTYLFYIILATFYYYLNIEIVPDFIGFTGGFKVGTDDCRFYFQINDVKASLPLFCQTLGTNFHSFSYFLKFLYPFTISNPLQIVIFNCIGISLIPILGKKIYLMYFPDEKRKSKIIFYLLLLSPSIIMNGIILLRDGWTAQLLLIFCYLCLNNKNKISLLFFAGVIFFLRPSFVVIPILFYLVNKTNDKKTFFRISALMVLFFIPLFYFLQTFGGGADLVRTSYVNDFLSQFEGESIFYKIMRLPFPLNILLSFIFFFFSPFLNFSFYQDGVFVIRNVFTLAESLIMIVLIPVFVKNIKYCFTNINIMKLFAFVCVVIFLLATMSLQFRHKIIIIPFVYILLLHTFKKSVFNFVMVGVYLIMQLIIIN